MIELNAPERVEIGKPIHGSFKSKERVSGRVRLTAGTQALSFTLLREGRDSVRSDGPRMRGKEGQFALTDWGEHPIGTELVLRFEGAKCWMIVQAPSD